MRRYAKDGVTPEIVDAYRLPQLVRGWEWGLLRFLRARVAGNCHCHHCISTAIMQLEVQSHMGYTSVEGVCSSP